MLARAIKIKKTLVADKVFGGGGGLTATQLSKYLSCTPQTIRDTIDRYGKLVGISYREFTHRPNVTAKRYYPVDLNTQPELF